MQIGVSNNGYIVIIDSDAETYWQKGELQPTFEGDTLIIRERDNRRDIILKANYDEIEDASTGEPFDTLESLKEFVQDNFFFSVVGGGGGGLPFKTFTIESFTNTLQDSWFSGKTVRLLYITVAGENGGTWLSAGFHQESDIIDNSANGGFEAGTIVYVFAE